AGGLISASIGALALWLGGTSLAVLPRAIAAWLIGYGAGVIVVAPLLLAWRGGGGEGPRNTGAFALSLVGTTLFGVVVLFALTPFHLRSWHLFPVLAAMAIAFSLRGVTLALLATSCVAIAAISVGVGPLSEIFPDPAGRALYAQEFLGLTAATLVVLAAAIDESRAKDLIAKAKATKAAILDVALDAIVTMAHSGRVVEWNDQAERMFGYSRDEAIGRDLADLIIPPGLRAAHREGLARYLRDGRSTIMGRRLELQALRADGAVFPVELAINVVQLDGGAHFTANLRDLTDRHAAEARLRAQDQRLRATYAHAPVGIAEVDAEGRFLAVNERLCRICQRTEAEMLGMTFWEVTHEKDRDPERDYFERQMRGELPNYTLEKRFTRANGEIGWVELKASFVEGVAGKPYSIRVIRDVTDEKRWAEQQSVLINELNHRVKNTLATVQSITAQTLRNAGADRQIQKDVEARLWALSRAHDILTRENWDGADLAEIVAVAAGGYAPQAERIRTTGEALRLRPETALGLAMALQELATNATKYGAWSNLEGRVSVDWTQGDGGRLQLTWREQGGPPVVAPTRAGFGTRLLQRTLSAEIGGGCDLRFEPGGVVCVITAMLEARGDWTPRDG
ncbi:MAG TPA: PAS domain S-box protein, partial [Caulobacter sp.]|nr:PAS domain S-box protein [Caulobacter sp.]